MIDGRSFDVFLSHNSRDKAAVEALARRLEDEPQLKPWLDKWNLVPGEPWQEALEEALDEAPGRDSRVIAAVPMVLESPYRDLEVFDEAHATFFFGREAMTQHLVETLRTTRFLAVLGPSGSGKSSLVRAGLLPELRAGALLLSQHWRFILFKPGAHPLQELAFHLAGGEPDGDVLASARRSLDHLRADERALHLQVRLSLAGQSSEACFCILVDQFEELFTLCHDQVERVRFIDNLRYVATIAEGRTVIIVTMRLDFMPSAAEYTDLAEILSGHQFLVSPMDDRDLRRAIEEPARLVGARFEEGLIDTIVEDVGHEPGMLPLLQRALLQLWERQSDNQVMTLQAYRQSGGVQGALAQRADAIFAGFTPERRAMTRRLMLRLTQPGEGTEDTRRRATLNELITCPDESEAVESVVRTLADARLLTTGEGEAGERVVDVAHEALIRGWPTLPQWIDEDRAGLRVQRRLTEAAQEWQRLHRDDGMLYRGARLAEAREWREKHEGHLNAMEREFLDASVALQMREEDAEKERQRRELAQAQALVREQSQRADDQAKAARRLRRRAILLAFIALLAVVAAGLALKARLAAQANEELAEPCYGVESPASCVHRSGAGGAGAASTRATQR
jgi:hypothetical protein